MNALQAAVAARKCALLRTLCTAYALAILADDPRAEPLADEAYRLYSELVDAGVQPAL